MSTVDPAAVTFSSNIRRNAYQSWSVPLEFLARSRSEAEILHKSSPTAGSGGGNAK